MLCQFTRALSVLVRSSGDRNSGATLGSTALDDVAAAYRKHATAEAVGTEAFALIGRAIDVHRRLLDPGTLPALTRERKEASTAYVWKTLPLCGKLG